MSDDLRKDTSTKVKETLVPDAMKSDTQKVKEATTDVADHAAREGQPDHTKSTLQETFDKSGRAKDDVRGHEATNESLGDKIKHAVGADKKDTHTNPA